MNEKYQKEKYGQYITKVPCPNCDDVSTYISIRNYYIALFLKKYKSNTITYMFDANV